MPLIACLQYQRQTPGRLYKGALDVECLADNANILFTREPARGEYSVPEVVNGVDDIS